MRFIMSTIDYGDVRPEVISGVASISLLSPNIVQVSFYRRVELMDGTCENRIVACNLWDRELWLANGLVYRQARAAIERGEVLVGGWPAAVGAH